MIDDDLEGVVKAGMGPDLGPFLWDDPFLLEDQLDEDERMLRDAAQAFAEDKLASRVTQDYRDEAVAPEILLKWVRQDCWALRSRRNTGDLARAM